MDRSLLGGRRVPAVLVWLLIAVAAFASSSAVRAATLYVAPGGSDGSSTCSVQATPCQTISYAISIAAANDHISIAAGQYISPLTITTDGLQLVGEDANNKPKITRISGGVDQPLLVIKGAKGVHVENIEFDMDQTFVAEGILAGGFVDGLVIRNNHFVSSRTSSANSSYSYRNAITINAKNSQNLPRNTASDGSTVTIDGNTIDGIDTPNGVFLRAGIQMDASNGSITGNTVTAGVQDISVRFATAKTGSTGTTVSIDGNHTFGRGLEIVDPNASTTQITVSNNEIHAIAGIDGTTPYPADYSLVRLTGNAQHVPTTVSGNTFSGYQGSYRGVLIENYPGIQLTSNIFTPASGAQYFVSLVVSNKQINTNATPQVPLDLSIDAQDNTFDGSGVAGAGAAVEFLNDNDADGAANFGSLLFGGSGTANHFDGQLRWYFHLDDYTCDHAGSTDCGFLDYPSVGTIPDTKVRPFSGAVSAADNDFGGVAPSAMTPAQRNALLAQTYDNGANPALGAVDYGLTATQSVVYVDASFAGNYGDSESFPFANATGACGATTAYFGLNAFATIADGLMHVQSGGTVCVAKGTYPASVTVATNPVQIIGDGNAVGDTVITGGVTLSVSGASNAAPLLLQNLRVSNSAGTGVDVKTASHLAFSGVAFANNGNVGLNFRETTDDVVILNSLFDGNTGAGLRTASTAQASNVSISGSTFSNNEAGIILFGAAGSGNGQIINWSVDTSQFLSNANNDTNSFGGGIWLKTAGAGSAISGFSITGSTFADNGSSKPLNQVGITVRARPNTTMTGVSICDNTFSETATPGTQLTGINVFDDTGNTGYQPITVCSSNTFPGMGHSVSGLEQHTIRGSQPVVNITGGSIANTEYINGLVTRVRDSATFPTITAAMNDSATQAGDEIHAPAGVYNEKVVITHNDMKLTGDGVATVISGANLAGSGVTLPSGRTGVTLSGFALQDFTSVGGNGGCVYGNAGNDQSKISNITISNCKTDRGGIFFNGPVDGVTIDHSDISNTDNRGIVIWNGLKSNITITNNHIHDLGGCCGIELQDGSASGVTVTGNTVENVGDSGMSFIGLTSGAGPNVISNNIVKNTGRFGIEIKLPNGTGMTSGDGSIVVSGNTVTGPTDLTSANSRDSAGIAVIRRSFCTSCSETDAVKGVVVSGNTVSGWQPATGSANDGFGIVAEGTNSHVYGNTVSGNEIGIQLQAGNDGYPGDSNQNATNDFFSRGNAPLTCLDLGTNTFSGNTTDSRSVSNPSGMMLNAGVHNTTRSTNFCSIQAAIDDTATQNGDTIVVDAGNYAENVVVNKGVKLYGPFQGTPATSRSGAGEAVINPSSPTVNNGAVIKVLADNVTIDGLTVDNVNNPAIASGGNFGGATSNVQIRNNRLLHIHSGTAIYTNGPYPAATDWTIAGNLISGVNSTAGSGINYWAADGGAVENNHIDSVAYAGIQIVKSSDVSVTGNVISNTVHSGISVGSVNASDTTDGNLISGNTITNANTAAATDSAGLRLTNGASNTTVICNSVSGSGTNGFATGNGSTSGVPDVSGALVFDNALTVASDISHNQPSGITIGSNWYGGGAATVNGSNAAGAQVATALPATPIGKTACGDNTTIGGVLVVSGTAQTTNVSTAFAAPLVARVVDQLGGSIAGASVTFTPPGSGASATLGTPSGTANFDGRLSTTAVANAIAGGYSVIAASGGKTAAFTLTNVGTPNVALTLNGPASTTTGTPTPGYTAQLSNTGSALTENVLVDFVISGSSALSAGDVTLEYDTGSGYAPIGLSQCGINLCGSFGPPGTGFPVGASYNSTTALRFTSTRSGAISLSASVDGVTSHNSYATSAMTVDVTAQATNIAANGPTTFTGDAEQALGALPSVIATDGNGNPAPGVSVTFATGANSGTLSGATQVTNSNGIATLGGWTLDATPGTNTVTATASGLAGSPVTFTASTPNVSLTFSGGAQALVTATTNPYTPFVDYTVMLGNTGSTTTQTVHYAITVVRIDDGNSANPGQPMAIAAGDVQVCVNDPTGGQADNKGCPTDWESLFYSESTGAFNGRPAVTFRYPINPAHDQMMPTIDPAQPLPGVKLRFKHGDYQMHVSVIGDSNGLAYATASGDTTVPNAAIAYNGPTSGQAEDALLSQTTLTNTGGRVAAGNVIVRVTLSDNGSAALTPADVEFDYQLGAGYQTLPWTQSGNNLVTYFGPGTGFPLEDGYNATTAGRAIFHREGSYSVLYEVLDAATLTPIYASQTVTPITIGANMASFSLSDMNQVYDGGPHAATVTPTPSSATYTTVYEARTGASCPASATGSDTTPPTNAGSYCVYVTATGSYSGSATGTLVVAKAVATVSIDGATGSGQVDRTYDGNPQAVTGTATATPSPTGTVTFTYNGDATAPTDAGSYSLIATLNDPNYTGAATGTLVVATVSGATITLDTATLGATFDGQPHAVTATTVPAGVSYSVTYVGDGSTSYPLTTTPPSAVGQYHVVATTTDPNYDQVSASGTLTIEAVDASLTLVGDPVGAVTDPSTPLYSMLSVTTNVSGTSASENVLANLIVTRGGGATAGDVDVDYRAATQERPSCVAATSSGFWCPLPLIDNGDGTLSGSFGPPGSGFPLTDGATSYFRTAYHRGGQYAVSVSVDGVSTTGETYASGTQSIEVAQLNLHNSGPATGSTGVNVDTTSTLTNTGTAAISTATAAPNNENVIGLFEVASGSGTVSASDLTVTYLAPDDAYHAIPLTACTGDPTHLCGEFGGAGFPVAAGYDATSLFRTVFTHDGSYSFNVSIVGASSQTIFATTSQAITVTASSATIAFDPASLNQVYNTGTHPVIVTTTPSGLSYTLTYDDGSGATATPPTNAGDYAVVATITESGYTGSASDTLHVAKANASVAISNVTQTYDGSPKSVTVTTDPAALAVDVTVTYAGGAAPIAVGSYAVVATVNNANYTGSSSATLQIVPAPYTDLAVSITDNRNYAQYGHALSYMIVIRNVGNQDVTGATVSDSLPPLLMPQQPVALHCYPTSSCSSVNGSDATIDIKAGSSITLVLDTIVNGDHSIMTDQILNSVTVALPSGTTDSHPGDNNATDATQAVIFRNGFELNGNGAQVPMAVGVMHPASIGSTADGSMVIPLSTPAPDRVVTTLASGSDAHGQAFRVEALRIGGALQVRMVTRGEHAEQASNWVAVNSGMAALGLGMVKANNGSTRVLLVGASANVEMALPGKVVSTHVVETPPAKG